MSGIVDNQWRRRHRLRHALSTRAFRWLNRRRIIRHRPGEQFAVLTHTLHLPRLPEPLAGLRIAHVSDLHVGHILRPRHLPAIVDAVNDANPHLIAVTGDLVDSSNRYLPAVVRSIARLEAPLGVYTVLGNHDHRDDADAITHAFAGANLTLLTDAHIEVDWHGRRIGVAGIDWAETDADLRRAVARACAGTRSDDLRLLLAHHPHALDFAASHGVDLVLSGHTHGGQFVARPSRTHGRDSLGLGNLSFRYPQGHYVRGETHLFVTNGLGGSFPLRFRCPAEVSLLELRTH